MNIKALTLVAIVMVLGGIIGGVVFWQNSNTNAGAAVKNSELEASILKSLTEDDVKITIENDKYLNPHLFSEDLKTNDEARKFYLNELRTSLALAAQARREGLTEKPEFGVLKNLAEKSILAHLYSIKNHPQSSNSFDFVTKEELDEFWKRPQIEEQFQHEMNTQLTAQQALAGGGQIPTLDEKKLAKARDRWARAAIVAEKARTDNEFVQKREVQLQLKLQEARMLATQYQSLYLSPKIAPTNEEISAFLTANPQYSVKTRLKIAEMVLRRALKGEDFVELFNEFNQHNFSSDKTGLHKNAAENALNLKFKEALAPLKDGEVAPQLIETMYGYNILKLENRKIVKDKKGTETVTIDYRQILIRTGFQAPTKNKDIPAPFERAEDIARRVVFEQKRQQAVENLAKQNGIQTPQDIMLS